MPTLREQANPGAGTVSSSPGSDFGMTRGALSSRRPCYAFQVQHSVPDSQNQGPQNLRFAGFRFVNSQEKSPMKLRFGCVVIGFLSFVLSLSAQTASSAGPSSNVP